MRLFETIAFTTMSYFRKDAISLRLLKAAQCAGWVTLVLCGIGALAAFTDGQGRLPAISTAALLLSVSTILLEVLAYTRKPGPGNAETSIYGYHPDEYPILLQIRPADLVREITGIEKVAYVTGTIAIGALLFASAIFGNAKASDGLAQVIFGHLTAPAMVAAGYLLLVEQRKKFRRALMPD